MVIYGIFAIRWPSGDAHLVVATTRPETMLGDCAVAVHPEDERYQTSCWPGNPVLPLVDRRMPVVADDYVDPEFGTGCVKITPAHDFNDYELGKRHDLAATTTCFDDNAAINHSDFSPEKRIGALDRFVARSEKIVADLDAVGTAGKGR